MSKSFVTVFRPVLVCRLALAAAFTPAALLKWFDPAGQSTYYGNLAHAAPAVGWAIVVGEAEP